MSIAELMFKKKCVRHLEKVLDLLKTWCSLLLEFLENSWNFEIFFQGPGKLLEKQMISLNSWKNR